MSKPALPSYRTTNWRAYNAALKQRGSLLIWFDPEMAWLAPQSGRRGRPAIVSDAAIQTCLMLKALFGLPLRQTAGLVASLLRLAKLDWPVPDFSTLCRRQTDLTVTIPYRSSQGALHLPIDSTGIKAMGEGEWSCRKHGASRSRQWCKVHLGIDAETLEVRAVDVTGSRVGDGPMLPNCSSRFRQRNGSTVSPRTALTTREPVTPPSPYARPGRSSGLRSTGSEPDPPHSPPAATAGLGRKPRLAPRPATTSCEQAAALVGRSGATGAAIIDEVASRPRCDA